MSQNKNYKNRKLISYGGKLGFICLSPSEILELWCIENTINHVWRKEQEVETENVKRVMNYPSPIEFYNNDVIVMEGSNGSMFYKPQNASLHLVNSHKLYCPIEVFPFCSEVVPIRYWSVNEKKKR